MLGLFDLDRTIHYNPLHQDCRIKGVWISQDIQQIFVLFWIILVEKNIPSAFTKDLVHNKNS